MISVEDLMQNSHTISSDIRAIQIRSAIDEIRNDRASGAAKQTVRAARLLVECARHTPEDLLEIARALTDAQPTTGPIYNLAAIAVHSPDVPAACHDFLDSMERNAARVAERAAAMVSDGESSNMLNRMKRKCTDMVLSIPGNLTFRVDANMAIAR